MQTAVSCGVGVRLPGGRQNTVLEISTPVLSRPIEASILSRSFPEGPTKGRPWRSSSAPGPSPTNRIGALELPSVKTRLVAVFLSPQPSKDSRAWRSSSTVSADWARCTAAVTSPLAPPSGGKRDGSGGASRGDGGAASARPFFPLPVSAVPDSPAPNLPAPGSAAGFAAFGFSWKRLTGSSAMVSSTPASAYHSSSSRAVMELGGAMAIYTMPAAPGHPQPDAGMV